MIALDIYEKQEV